MISTTTVPLETSTEKDSLPDENGRFGPYGGSYVPETLYYPLKELEEAYNEAKLDHSFKSELHEMLRAFAGRPTELYFAERLTEKITD